MPERSEDVPLVSRLIHVRWTPNGLALWGRTRVPGVTVTHANSTLRLYVGDTEHPVTRDTDPWAAAESPGAWVDDAETAWHAEGITRPGKLRLELDIAGVTLTGAIMSCSSWLRPLRAPLDHPRLALTGPGKTGMALTRLPRPLIRKLVGDQSFLRAHPELYVDLPQRLESPTSRFWTVGQKDGSLALQRGKPFKVDEIGPYHQRQLGLLFEQPVEKLAERTLFAEAFAGKRGGDNVLPIVVEWHRRHPDWQIYFSVSDFEPEPIPLADYPFLTPVLRDSRAYVEALRHARLLVQNSVFPHYFRKQPGQFYLNTWHGTPLKKIGFDVPAGTYSLSYLDLLGREVTYWDALLAQNEFSAANFAAAFRYAGPVLTTGYPRNDALREPATANDQLVVLYAPTWRDDGAPEVLLDAAVFAADLPNAELLVRAHHTSANPGVTTANTPDLSALLRRADVLVTDYSSMLFDFAVTGKPIILLTPDLAHYRDETRGLNLPLAELPAPVCNTTAEVVAQLVNLPALQARYAEPYAAFQAKYVPFDDGHATARVVDYLESQL